MKLQQLLLEKQRREEREQKIKELLLLIDFSKGIRREIVHKYISTQLLEPLNTKLRQEVKRVLFTIRVIPVTTHNKRLFKKIDNCRNFAQIKALKEILHDVGKQPTDSGVCAGETLSSS